MQDKDFHNNIIVVAVVGSAGSGKKSLFEWAQSNALAAREHTLQWHLFEDPEQLIDLRPDVVLQVVDCTDLEESLVITPQLIDMHRKLVLALNRYDQLLATGHSLDYKRFASLTGLQASVTNAENGEGLQTIVGMIVDAFEDKKNTSRHLHVEYGVDVERSIDELSAEIARCPELVRRFSKRFLSIRFLERPEETLNMIGSVPDKIALAYCAEKNRRDLAGTLKCPPEQAIHEARHAFIRGALNETLLHSDDNSDHTLTQRIDALLTNRWVGFPIMVLILYLVFQCTFTLGAYPQAWIQAGVDWLCRMLSLSMPQGWLTSLLVDGVLQGVGAVLAFLPNIIILFFFISLMEDSGYMSRVAYLMDKIMHRVGLHGKSFVPMLVGFGCNVPAIMAARSIDNRKDRTLTMLMIPFMSCGARLPVYMLFVAAFFPHRQALVMLSLYLLGVMLSILFALIMKRTSYFRKDQEDFVSELPSFRAPIWKNTWRHIWERCLDYLKKISTVILWASIIIWALYYFPRNTQLTQPYGDKVAELRLEAAQPDLTALQSVALNRQIDSLLFEMEAVQKENSALASVGKWISPVMKPLGFDWRMTVCILTGLPAKEAIVSTMGILYHQENDANLENSLRDNPFFTPLKSYAFMIFVLLYFPCIATIAALRREIGRKWAAFTVVHSLAIAWLMAYLITLLGTLAGLGV